LIKYFWRVNCRFSEAKFLLAFSILWLYGSASFALDGDKWGYVNLQGKEIISPKYITASPFNHGFAKVFSSEDAASKRYELTRFVDVNGKEYLAPSKKRNDAGLVSKFVSQSGKVIVQDNFDQILDVRGDFMLVRTPYEFSVANRKYPGEPLMHIRDMSEFGKNGSTGNFWIKISGNYYEFTGSPNTTYVQGFELVGMESTIENYVYVGEFSDGLAPALDKNGFWSYVNPNIEQVIGLPMNCCHASSFHEGLAEVSFGGRKPPQNGDGQPPFGPFPGARFGFIDIHGRVKIPIQYPCPPRSNDSRYGVFKDGYALATADVNESIAYGYIDRSGKFVIPAIYYDLGELREGMAAFTTKAVGFRKNKVAIPSIDTNWLQFFKQFNYIGMDKQELHDLLGKPAGEIPAPKAEFFLISRDCLGSTSLAVQFNEHDKAVAYSIGSFGAWFGPSLTNDLQPSIWLTQLERPEPGEDLYEFFSRVATSYFTAPYLVPKDTLPLRQLDKSFTRPGSDQQIFNAEVWKSERNRRPSMLFALFQMDIKGKAPEQVEILLGKPDRSTDNAAYHQQSYFYDLKIPGYDKVEMECQFNQNHLSGLGLLATDDSGFSNQKSGNWILKNPTTEDISREFNAYHAFVGLPLKEVCQVTSTPETVPDTNEKLYRVGDFMEIRATGKDGSVAAFRMQTRVKSKQNGKPIFSKWEALNYRPVNYQKSSTVWQFFDDDMERYIVNPSCSKAFDQTNWAIEPHDRKHMLFDLVHEYRLIGRDSADMYSLLGEPKFIQSDKTSGVHFAKIRKVNPSDPLTQNCVWYPIEESGGRTGFLQIALKNDKVIAFRLAIAPNADTDRFEKQLSFYHDL
jgi:WG containing repeat